MLGRLEVVQEELVAGVVVLASVTSNAHRDEVAAPVELRVECQHKEMLKYLEL